MEPLAYQGFPERQESPVILPPKHRSLVYLALREQMVRLGQWVCRVHQETLAIQRQRCKYPD